MKSRLWNLSLVILFSFLSFQELSRANEDQKKYLATVSSHLAEIMETQFNEASQSLFRKYCPDQFDIVNSALLNLMQAKPNFPWSYFANVADEWMGQKLRECPQWEKVDTLLRRFNQLEAEQSNQILIRIQDFVSSQAHDTSNFSEIVNKADELFDMLAQIQLHYQKILFDIENRSENENSIPDYLKWHFYQSEKANLPMEGQLINQHKKSTTPQCEYPQCKKRSLTLIKCHCEKYFCAKHRMAETHQCQFDYKSSGRKEIESRNPKVDGPKVDQI